jgi:hypothetical protein
VRIGGKVSRENLLIAALVLHLLLLAWELVLLRLLLLLLRAGFENRLIVLLMLQFGGHLAVGWCLTSVLAVPVILSRVWQLLCVRRRNRPDGRVLLLYVL